MRRRLEVFIPIVLLSIMVQLLAPIGAFRVVAYAVSDPLYMATICSGMASSQNAAQTTTANAPHGANCCGFCSANTSSSFGWKLRNRCRRRASARTRRHVRHPPFPDDLATSHQGWCGHGRACSFS